MSLKTVALECSIFLIRVVTLLLVIHYLKYFEKILLVISTSMKKFQMKVILEWNWADDLP